MNKALRDSGTVRDLAEGMEDLRSSSPSSLEGHRFGIPRLRVYRIGSLR